MSELALRAIGLNKRFGGVAAAENLDLDVRSGEVHGLVGPNGAGKSTVLNIISGLVAPDGGKILLAGQDITHQSSHARARRGLARTFQNVKLFGRMSVKDHVLVACDSSQVAGLFRQLVHSPQSRRERRSAIGLAEECLDYVGLYSRSNDPASGLSYGEQRRLEIARALATKPSLILLDEPTAGMNRSESDLLAQLVEKLRQERGITFLLVEHNMNLVREACDFVTVMSFGVVVARGRPRQVLDTEAVREVYFGTGKSRSEGLPAPAPLSGRTEAARSDAPSEDGSVVGGGRNDLLRVTDLTVAYGPIPAVKAISFHVGQGELVSFIGSNGAGKSTTLNSLVGVLPHKKGEIRFDGSTIGSWSATRRVRAGLNIVPEGRRVLAQLTVEENLQLARKAKRPAVDEAIDLVYELFPRLADRRSQPAGSLSGGEQQMLALGRALATSPRLLMLDEPSMGLAPAIVDVVMDAIRELKRQGLSMLLVEQNGTLALDVSDKVYVLERGEIVMAGRPAELRSDSRLVEAYLGSSADSAVEDRARFRAGLIHE